MITVGQLDHVAITSSNPERSVAFYRDILGMTVARVWPGEVTALQARSTFLAISWQGRGRELVPQPPIAIHHFAFRVDKKTFAQAQEWLPESGINIEMENHGTDCSIYLHDPDGHLIELTCYEFNPNS